MLTSQLSTPRVSKHAWTEWTLSAYFSGETSAPNQRPVLGRQPEASLRSVTTLLSCTLIFGDFIADRFIFCKFRVLLDLRALVKQAC